MAVCPGEARLIFEFLQRQTLLSQRDKRGVLSLISKTLDLETFVHAASMSGIAIFRADKKHASHPSGTNKSIYRVSGLGEIDAPAAAVFEFLCNLDLMPEWDMLYKGARYLTFARDPSGSCEVGHIHLVYGLPGVSRIVSDRDFLLRTVRVFFPNGMRVLYCSSVSAEEKVEGDPGPRPCTIRGHMCPSGYVVVPAAGGRSSCLHVSLQVDPKGWIPSSVVNLSLEAIPLNIQRIRNTLQALPPQLLSCLPLMNQSQSQGALPLPRQAPEDSASHAKRGGGGGEGMHRVKEWLDSTPQLAAAAAGGGGGSQGSRVVGLAGAAGFHDPSDAEMEVE